jgi:capsular exopolysaccharide synthesis family protein
MDRTRDALALAEPRPTHDAPRFAPVVSESSLDGIAESIRAKFVVSPEIAPEAQEQYRRLAATLHHAQSERDIRVVMVVSAATGEGKTLTATNVALTLSESYQRRVVLVDADLRRPSIDRIFNVPNVRGLNEGLRDGGDRPLPLAEITPNLSLLTAGAPNPDPMSVLSSSRMRRVLQEAAARFDWVVVDTPPIAVLPDAHLLAAMVDVAILVIRAGVTPLRLVQRAVSTLGRDRVVGVVLNGTETRNQETAYLAGYHRR